MKTGRKSILFLLSVFLFSALGAMNFSAGTFRNKVERRKQGFLMRGGQNRIDSSTSLTERSRAIEMRLNRFYRDSSCLDNRELLSRLESLRSELVEHSFIQSLNFSFSNFGREELEVLIDILINNNVSVLNLVDCDIDDEDAELLASILPDTNLSYLNLSFNEIENCGARALINTLNNGFCGKIDLSGNFDISFEVYNFFPQTIFFQQIPQGLNLKEVIRLMLPHLN